MHKLFFRVSRTLLWTQIPRVTLPFVIPVLISVREQSSRTEDDQNVAQNVPVSAEIKT